MHQRTETTDVGLDALLAFADEFDLHELNEITPSTPAPTIGIRRHTLSCDSSISSSSKAPKPKSRPRRDDVELRELRAKVSELEVELAHAMQSREASSAREPKRFETREWKQEAERQSSLRSAAQWENEHLKAKLQTQIQIAKSLVNTLKRNTSHKILQALSQYESSATTRETEEDDLTQAYLMTDEVIAAAQLPQSEPAFFDAQITQHSDGPMLESRSHHIVPGNVTTVSAALLRFNATASASHRFQYNESTTQLDETTSHAFQFQCRHDPSAMRFRGQILWRQFTSDERVVFVWKTLTEPDEGRVRMCSNGWIVIQQAAANSTRVQLFSRVVPVPFGNTGSEAAQQDDVRMSRLVEFMLHLAEEFADITAQVAMPRPSEQSEP